MELKNKLALVTGGAHRVGKGIASSLAEKGADLVIHYYRSEDEAKQTQQELQEFGCEVSLLQTNLMDYNQVQTMAKTVKEEFADLRILVNSAASFIKKSISNITLEDWDKSLHVNVRAPFFLTQNLSPILRSNSTSDEKSVILNILDLSAVQPWLNFSTHAISKVGLSQFTKISARELAPEVRVNGIIPGPILPPVHAKDKHTFWAETLKLLPLKRKGNPQFVGHTAVFLAENEFITGALVPVDGGEGLIGPIPYYKDL